MFFRGVKALVSGHTGFKGSWLCAALKREGATVAGLALDPERNGQPNLFEAAKVADGMQSIIGDIRDFSLVQSTLKSFAPEVVFHLAAQPLVRRSYREPLETFSTNVMGTAHVLEAARHCPSVRAVVCVTTDKVYKIDKSARGFRETDPLGGVDPYSASKAAAEMVSDAYLQAMFPLEGGRVALATARGGNVVGGGDWSEDRLIPDIVRSIDANEPIILRNPTAVRPWQHVLDLVNGYLVLARALLETGTSASGAWNFGPQTGNEISVDQLAHAFAAAYGGRHAQIEIRSSNLPETQHLALDITKATTLLPWRPRLGPEQTIALTAAWYRGFHRENRDAALLLDEQIQEYFSS